MTPTTPGRRGRRGLAVSELLLVILLLAVGFGLVVNLARRVRRESSHGLAARVLVELEAALRAYRDDYDASPQPIDPLLPPDAQAQVGRLSEPGVAAFGEAVLDLEARAAANNRQALRVLAFGMRRPDPVAEAAPPRVDAAGAIIDTLGSALYEGGVLRDPWGSPFAYMPAGSPLIGTAAGDRPFFFSAGPDGLFLTRGDNLYGYELAGGVDVPGLLPADEAGDAVDSPYPAADPP